MKFGIAGISPLGLALASLVSGTALAEQAPGLVPKHDVIVVTGSRIEQKLSDVAGSVAVMEGADIERQLSNSLADVFRYDPSITSTGNAGQAQELSIRGVGGNRLIYIKDGRRLNDGYAGGGGLLVGRGYLDVAQIQRIEVAKSAASSLYGSDGLGGIVVITTPDPADLLDSNNSYSRINAGFQGQSDEYNTHLMHARGWGDTQAMASFSYREGNETQNFSETLPGYDYDSYSLLSKVNWDISPQQHLKLTLDGYRQQNQQVISAGSTETDDLDRQLALSLDYTSTLSTRWYDAMATQLYISDYQQQSDQIRAGSGRTGPYTDYNDYRFEQQIIGFRWQGDKTLTSNKVDQHWVFGTDIDYYDTERPRFKTRVEANGTLSQNNEPQKAFPGANTFLGGVFVQNNMALKNLPVKLIAGLRLDHYSMQAKTSPLYDQSLLADVTETAVSPKLGVIYSHNQQLNLYVQYAQGFKIPPHDQAYQNHGVEPFYAILPNPNLEPETSYASELGLKYHNDDISVNLAAFYADFDDFIDNVVVGSAPSPIPGVQRVEYQYQNKDSARIYGAEASINAWLNDAWEINTAIAYSQGKDSESDSYLSSISPLTGTLMLRYNADNYYLGALLSAAASMNKVPADDSAKTAGWGTLDILAGLDLGQLRLNLALQNVLDKEYIPYQRIAGQNSDASLGQYTQPGRNLSAQVTYQF
ncbi:TonB-dependent hemoglobin/transferrin/lactoferrin family receptor [Lacimicrobium alkaliphilum]|uniref:Ligand-gated channel protein n=1 Tax=Lacimicrobium alkaliphilum TaxID=1526571 RepID=A0ABQ1R899_9ALTE|nr:TonB-dependent hemoglobin/transferrin/lactoferrin family receptor [Lacimicrobium alkaliphilum]GGD59551.1 ligand-gated channel protein [Lacimicrobium alkaliphilum]